MNLIYVIMFAGAPIEVYFTASKADERIVALGGGYTIVTAKLMETNLVNADSRIHGSPFNLANLP